MSVCDFLLDENSLDIASYLNVYEDMYKHFNRSVLLILFQSIILIEK